MNLFSKQKSKSIIIGVIVSLAIIVLIVKLIPLLAQYQAIFTRGPFLQNIHTHDITICWETDKPASAKVLIFDRNGKKLRSFKTPQPATRHDMIIAGLKAGTKYNYEIKSPASSSAPVNGSFKTPPKLGNGFEFAAWGDSRSNRDICEEMAKQILKTHPPIVIHTGDLVYTGTNLSEWNWMFFEPCRDLLRSSVIYPAIGNHELGKKPDGLDGRSVFIQTFVLPGKENYYSFDYGDAHFLMLDSNPEFRNNLEQYQFANKDLQKTNALWRFVVWHHPIFTSGGHGNQIDMRTRYCPLLAKHNVDVIITGHNHNYQRSKPIKHTGEQKQKHPYIHLVTGGGGARLYPVRPEGLWYAAGAQTNHFIHFRIDGKILSAKVIDIDGKIIDTFNIDKSKPAADTVNYELIELERLFAVNLNVDKKGRSRPPILLDHNQTAATILHKFTNPLPQPITVTVKQKPSNGLIFNPETITKDIPQKQSLILEFPFRVTNPAKILPHMPLEIKVESPLGSFIRQVHPLPIAVRRTLSARKTTGPIIIDGVADEPAWKTASTFGRFLDRSLKLQNPEKPTTLKLLHNDKTLYLCVIRKKTGDDWIYLHKQFTKSDRIIIHLAGKSSILDFRIDAQGTIRPDNTNNQTAKAGVKTSDDAVTWELALPLDKFIEAGKNNNQLLYINVIEYRGNNLFCLSPTFEQEPDGHNSAYLKLQ